MAAKISPPQYSKAKGYERYKLELLAWKEVTDIKKEKQGIVVALSLPENDDVADDRRGTRSTNPKGPDGKPLLCRSCGSFRHLIAKCPDSWENRATVNIAEQMEKEQSDDAEAVLFTMFQPSGMNDMEEVILLTGLNENNVKQISMEARKCAVLDIACSSTVCGEHWLEDYLNSLNSEERKKASRTDNSKIFKFGGEQLRSEGLFKIPAVVAGKETFINTDMVKSDIPLLLSKRSMKRAGAKLNLQDDTAEIFGVKVTLNETSSGHYCIPIDKEKTTVESICAVNIEELSSSDKFKTLVTLHRQFAHPPEGRFIALLRDAKAWNSDFQGIVTKIYEQCEVCKLYKRTPPRPVVAMSMASKFNEKVCMDLKKWKNRWILHMIDMWSRFSVSVFIDKKTTL